MARTSHTLKQWDDWLNQNFLGQYVLESEKALMQEILGKHFGKHVLLIGVPAQNFLFQATTIPCHTLISPLPQTQASTYIQSDLDELPILTGSIDLVLMPHTLEFVDNPRQLLSEACRIVKPEGLILIKNFNPYSLWGLKKFMNFKGEAPWNANFILNLNLKQWLRLADFEIETQRWYLFRPPFANQNLFNKLKILESAGNVCDPILGGGYTVLARAKVIPLTPIRLKWKQRLTNISIASNLPGKLIG